MITDDEVTRLTNEAHLLTGFLEWMEAQGYFVGAEVYHPVSRKGENRGTEFWGRNRDCPHVDKIWHFCHWTRSEQLLPNIVDAYLLGPQCTINENG